MERMRNEIAGGGAATLSQFTPLKTRGSAHLSASDTIVASVGIRDETVQRNLDAISAMGETFLRLPDQPRLLYIASLTQHFRTDDGTWGKTKKQCQKQCQPTLPRNPRLEREKAVLHPGKNVHELLTWEDTDLGDYHIGNGDCSHFCMPGVPDALAARVFQRVRSLQGSSTD